MSTDPRAALNRLVAALERHLEASSTRRGEDDPAVVAAYDDVGDAFEAYDAALYDAFGEMTPLVVYGGPDDSEDDSEDSDDDEDDDEDSDDEDDSEDSDDDDDDDEDDDEDSDDLEDDDEDDDGVYSGLEDEDFEETERDS